MSAITTIIGTSVSVTEVPGTFVLQRDPFGKLLLITADGQRHHGVTPVRAFPIQSPDDGIALVNADGQEVGWIDRLNALPDDLRTLVEEELRSREFMPEIAHIVSVTSYATPCTWRVDTDRGATRFVLRGEEDIRRISADSLLISDSHGIHFLIRDLHRLDKHSRKILDRFL